LPIILLHFAVYDAVNGLTCVCNVREKEIMRPKFLFPMVVLWTSFHDLLHLLLKAFDSYNKYMFLFNLSVDSEAMLLAALEDLRAGRALVETAATYHIPRSTLYVRARAQGIPLTITRQEHSGERVQAAIQAVAGKLTIFLTMYNSGHHSYLCTWQGSVILTDFCFYYSLWTDTGII